MTWLGFYLTKMHILQQFSAVTIRLVCPTTASFKGSMSDVTFLFISMSFT